MGNYTMQAERSDARLLYSASETDANMLWATRFFAPDPFIFIEHRRRRYVVLSDLELDRAKKQARVNHVFSCSEYARRSGANGVGATLVHVISAVLSDLKINSVSVPAAFPVGLADQLRSHAIRVSVKDDPFWPQREIKSKDEIRHIQESLRVAKTGMQAGIEAVRQSTIGRDGYLYHDGNRLTSETLKRTINRTIIEQGCVPSHTIVASGNQCVDPHNEGSGTIRANRSIIMDIFPRSQKTGYFGDITRTVVRGKASKRLRHAYRLVEEAQHIAFRRIRNGADGFEIHQEILDHFSREGFPTGPMGGRMQGFFHGTGHGLGLEIHEPPGISGRRKTPLRTGHVVTVEPGLYYQGMGGVRLEDVVVVTDTGCRNLVRIPKCLEV